MGLSCLICGFFNLRVRSKTFAGDVASISMALFFGYYMIKTIIDSVQIGYILFFSIYAIDTVITIAKRILKSENMFEADRSHLYRYLANEWRYSYVLIAVIYAISQLLINGLVICLDGKGSLSLFETVDILPILTMIYLLVRRVVASKVTVV